MKELTDRQYNTVIQILHQLDGCCFQMSRRWKKEKCSDDTGNDFDCYQCQARDLLKELGEKEPDR